MQIEPGVPMRGYTTRPPKYRFPLAEMEVGDSFFVSYGDMDAKSFLQTSRSLISRFGKAYARKYATRRLDDGFRVWRIE